MTFQMYMHKNKVPQPDYPLMDKGWNPNPFRSSPAIHTSTHRLNWKSLWTRRRSYHSFENPQSSLPKMDPPSENDVSVGDISLAAWPDFYYGYIFVGKRDAKESIGRNWAGGYNLQSIDGAERYS